VIEGVEDGCVRDAVLVRRPMDLHIRNIVIRKCEEGNRSVNCLRPFAQTYFRPLLIASIRSFHA
jgi:hypothetical protein